MKSTFILEPEVPGALGPRTLMDRSVHPPKITLLHFIFDGWLGDQLVECFPCYLVTASLAKSFENAGVSGFELAGADIEMSERFGEMYPTRELPQFKWLKVVGEVNASDLFITAGNRLAASQKALDLVLATNPQGMEYHETL